MRKVVYTNSDEREAIINSAVSRGEYLIEDAITSEGKYLIFDTKTLQIKSQPPSIENRLKAVEDALLNML
ncbi:hypothetical protein [Calorimonas adulescens]|uniref:Uncharacterized protein n=1 Tax=Calorimonas adulescens TaxID=2606906 RepID=A0A5D8QBV3_9THEO|nr:hypothetical protein [Calorimonas adulescens]TZE82011.1 hypothetical protein FWJ32_07200 [Calorimonas adulescens]